MKKGYQVVLSGLIAAFMVHFYVDARLKRELTRFNMIDILIASRDLPARTILSEKDLSSQAIPQQFVQPGSFKATEEYKHLLIGKTTRIVIPLGTQMIRTFIDDPEIADLDRKIRSGKRAYPLVVPRTEMTRMISVGSHIDLIANITIVDQKGVQRQTARTILQNVPVLSVRDEISSSHKKPDNQAFTDGLLMTLELSPAESEQLALAEKLSQGDFRIVIRSVYDHR